MQVTVTPTGDVDREIEIVFQDGALQRKASLTLSEAIEGAGKMMFSKSFTNVRYVKIGVPSDIVPNRNGSTNDGPEQEDMGYGSECVPEDCICDEGPRHMTATGLTGSTIGR